MSYRAIKGYEKNYEIDVDGNIRSLSSNKILKPGISKKGYKIVSLWRDGKGTTKYVHRLVAETFLPMKKDKKIINHKDGNKLNNNINNLEWVTYSENNKHAYDNKLKTVSDLVRKSSRKMIIERNSKEKPRSIPIIQLDEDENIINEFSSIKEAASALKINRSTIYRYLKSDRKTCKTFILKYKEELKNGNK